MNTMLVAIIFSIRCVQNQRKQIFTLICAWTERLEESEEVRVYANFAHSAFCCVCANHSFFNIAYENIEKNTKYITTSRRKFQFRCVVQHAIHIFLIFVCPLKWIFSIYERGFSFSKSGQIDKTSKYKKWYRTDLDF